MNKMRISLTERNGEIRGKIETDGDALFVLECLAEIVGQISVKSGVDKNEIVRDLGMIVRGKVS